MIFSQDRDIKNSGGTVLIARDHGQWTVSVFENGTEHAATFDIEQHAMSYADGQRARLGLDAVSHGS